MLRHIPIVGLVLVCLLIGANSFALDPIVCDPTTDAECVCPSGSVCATSSVKNLTSPDDPQALRQLANINSVWNDTLGVFEVTVDATQLSAEGIMKLNSNGGKWDSSQELLDYTYELLGLSQECWDMDRPFPPMMIDQTGVVTRYDQFTDDWASEHVPSLIFAAITDADGHIFIDGQQTGFDWTPGYHCTTGGDAYDEHDATQVKGRQCSTAMSTEEEHCVVEFDGQCFKEHDCVDIPKRMASTQISTYKPANLPARIICQGSVQNGTVTCDWKSNIIHILSEVDRLDLQNYYFLDEAGPYPDPTPASEPDVSDLYEYSISYDGVCGHGEVFDGQTNFVLQTKAGWYDSSAQECAF